MTEGKIKVVYKEPGKAAEIKEIPNNLYTLQELVGGYIQAVTIPYGEERTLVLICDEEGKLKIKQQPNIYSEYLQDVICGPIIIVGENGEDFGSIAEQDAQVICDNLNRSLGDTARSCV